MPAARKLTKTECVLELGMVTLYPPSFTADGGVKNPARIGVKVTHRGSDPTPLLEFLAKQGGRKVQLQFDPGEKGCGIEGHVGIGSVGKAELQSTTHDRAVEQGDDEHPRVSFPIEFAGEPAAIKGLFEMRLEMGRCQVSTARTKIQLVQEDLIL